MTSIKKRSAGDRIGRCDCVDFVNTVDWRGTPEPKDGLQEYRDLLAWCGAVGLVSRSRIKRLRRLAQVEPEAAVRVLLQARGLREALHGVFLAWSAGDRPGRRDINLLNEALARAPARQHVRWSQGDYDWSRPEEVSLAMVLWPIAWSAADLLTEGEPERLRSCADDRCGWLFYDASRNRSRRWCSMSDCGNRAKAKRHYYRKKARSLVDKRTGP